MHKMIKVYTVHRRNDDRHDGPITDICATESLAESIAKGTGWCGGNAGINERDAVEADGEVFLLHPETTGAVSVAHSVSEVLISREQKERIEALAKLTPRERGLLGVG
jgi:hypothetical protein